MFKEVGKEISFSCDNDGPWEERIKGRESVFIPCLTDLIPRYFYFLMLQVLKSKNHTHDMVCLELEPMQLLKLFWNCKHGNGLVHSYNNCGLFV